MFQTTRPLFLSSACIVPFTPTAKFGLPAISGVEVGPFPALRCKTTDVHLVKEVPHRLAGLGISQRL